MLKTNIQLFGDGEGTAPATGETVQDAAETNATPGAEETGKDTTPSRAELYKQFKEEYKPEIQNDFEFLLDKRLKKSNSEAKQHSEYKEKASKIIDAIAVKYGIDSSDIDGLIEKVEADNSYWEDAAYENGMSVEKYKLLKQTEKENERLILREQQAQQEEMQRQFIDRINKEVSIAKSIYPDFDINVESQDDKFRGLVERGVDVRTAYEIMHRDEFIRQAQVKAAKEVSDKIQMDAINNTSRPRENGIGGGGAVSATANIEKMSREEMAKAKEAARRGEKITFRS